MILESCPDFSMIAKAADSSWVEIYDPQLEQKESIHLNSIPRCLRWISSTEMLILTRDQTLWRYDFSGKTLTRQEAQFCQSFTVCSDHSLAGGNLLGGFSRIEQAAVRQVLADRPRAISVTAFPNSRRLLVIFEDGSAVTEDDGAINEIQLMPETNWEIDVFAIRDVHDRKILVALMPNANAPSAQPTFYFEIESSGQVRQCYDCVSSSVHAMVFFDKNWIIHNQIGLFDINRGQYLSQSKELPPLALTLTQRRSEQVVVGINRDRWFLWTV